MKLIKLLMLFLVGALWTSGAAGQANATLNILTLNSGQVGLGGTVDIQVTVGNTGPTSSILANKVRAQISIPSAIASPLPNAQQTGLPPGWTITVNSGGTFTVCNGSDVIPVGAQRQIFIKVQGTAIGGPSTVNGSLVFSSGTSCTVPGTLAGDNSADNTGTSSIQVIAAPACSLALTANAGTIACNGNTTTLTATATGAAGAVEYSLNGGAFQTDNTFTVSGGTYTVTAREVSNTSCTATASPVTVTEPSAVTASASAGAAILCNGGSTILTVTASGGTGTLEYSLNGGAFQAGNTFSAGAGTHTVTVRDANGCTATTAPVTVTQPTLISFSGSVTTAIPVPGGTGTITVTGSGGTGAITYVITSGTTINTTGAASGVFTGLLAGNYSFTATDANGCTATTSVTLSNPVAGNANATLNILTLNSGQVTVGSVVDIQVTVGNTGPSFIAANKVRAQISIPSAIASALPNAQQTGLPAGWTITVNAGGTFTVCNGTDAIPAGAQRQIFIKVQGTAVGGPSTVNGSLLFSNGTSCTVPGTLAGDATADNTGTSSIQVLAGACALGVTASAGTINCNGGTTTLTATASGAAGAVEYSLNGGAFQAGNTFTVPAGAYTVTAREAATPTCTATSNTVTVTQPTQLTAAESHTAVLCFGGSSTVTISATGGTAPYTGTGTFTQAAGTQSYTVTDANGCTSSVSVTVTQPASAVSASSTVGAAILCFGGSTTVTVSASGGTAPYTGTGVFTTGGGAYSYTVTDANGCTAVTSGTIAQPTQISATASVTTPIAFPGGTGTITVTSVGGTGAKTYVITSGTTINTTGATSGVFTGLLAGNYTFTATDANGCTGSASATLSTPVAGNANATLNLLTLNSGQVNLGDVVDVQVTVGNSGPSFIGANKVRAQISIPSAIASALPNAQQTGLPAGWTITVNAGGTFTVCNGTDVIPAGTQRQIFIKVQGTAVGGPSTINGSLLFSNGTSCTVPGTLAGDNTADNTGTSSIQVLSTCNLSLTASAGTIACNGGTTTLTATASGAAGAVEYSLNGGAFQSGNTFTVPAGTYTVTAREVATPACTATAGAVTVTQPVLLVAAESHTAVLCFGGSSTVTISATGGTAPYTGTGTFTQVAGTQSYTVTDSRGCTSSVSVTVTQPTQLVAAQSHTTVSCFGGSSTVTISATGGTAPYTGTGTFTQAAGTQSYTVTDANGCTSSVSVTVTQPTQLVAAQSHTAVLCFGGSSTVTITATGGTAPYTGTGTFTQAAGTQSYTVTDANGCTSSVSVTVTQPTAVAASATSTPVTTIGGSDGTATVTASGGTAPYTYSWAPGGQTTATATGLTAGSYTVTVTDANGCTATATTTVGSPACNIAATASAGTIACFGGTTTLTVSVTGGTAPFQYSLNGGAFQAGNTFTVSAGNYTVSVKDASNCTATSNTVIVTQPASAVSASSTVGAAILCFGGSTTVTVTASGGTAPYTGTGVFTTGGGAYSYTVTDANGCTAVTSGTIAQPTQISVTASVTTPIAFPGGTGTITVTSVGGTGAKTYVITSGTTINTTGATSGVFTGLLAGNYTFTATDANGCTGSASATLSTPVAGNANATLNLLTLNSGQVNLGDVVDVQVTVGNSGPSFIGANKVRAQISIPSAIASALPNAQQTGLPAGWTITVNAGGTFTVCNGTDVIPAGTQRQIFIKVQGTAAGGPSTINGSLLFSNGTSCTVPGTLAGDNTADNTGTSSIQVITNCSLSLTASAGTIACNGGTTTLTATASGAAGAVEYSLNGGAFQPGNTFTVPAGTYTVSAREVASPACTATATPVTVTEPTAIAASASAGTVACGTSTTLTVTATGGTGSLQYSLNGGAFQAGNTFTVGAGTYTVTVKDDNNCTATTAPVTVTSTPDNTNPTITAPANVSACTNSGCTATGVLLGTPVTADNCTVASVTNNAPGAFPLGTTTVTWTVTDGSGNTATASQTVTVTDCTVPAIYVNRTGLVPGITGVSSSASPYLLPVKNGVKFRSILSVGDNIGGYQMVGIPDGLGAFDNNDGTFTLLMNHELGNTSGVARAHGAIGTFVSKWVINKSTLQVLSGSDLMQQVYNWNNATQSSNATTSTFAFNRFCSGDLPAVSAFYNPATGLGTNARIYMHGEEGGATGYQMGTVANGPDAGKAYVLGKFNLTTNGSGLTGVGAWENALANPFAQDKTIVIGNNDGGTGIMANSVSVYVGTKTNAGTEVDKAGLTNGTLSFVNVTGNPAEIVNTTTRATNITSGTAFTLSGTSSTTFSRPEDGVWNPANPSQYFFVTTDQIDQVADGLGTQVGRSRLWRLNFTDITNPALGGTIDLLLNGTEGQVMFDNLTADKFGHLLLQEDVGNSVHNGKIWQYTIATGALTIVAKHDPARFGDRAGGVTTAATAPFNADEESSGIIDVSDILGNGMFITSDQAHYATGIPAALAEGGQLLAMFNPESVGATATAMDTLRVCSGTGVNLGTPATSDNCSVASVTNDAPSTFPVGNTTVTWTVTDGSGNTATATQVVIVSSLAATAASTAVTTTGGTDGTATVTATGGTAPYTYVWAPGGQTTATATGLAAGAYTVTVTDALGCSVTATTTVGSPACNLAVSASAGAIACNGGTTTLTATATGANGAVEYSLNGGAYQAGNTFTVSAGTYTVTAREVSNPTCTATTTVTVSQPAALVAASSAGTILCNGGTTTVTVTATGGTAPYAGTGTFTVSAGAYSYTVTDANGCTSVTSGTVTQPTALAAASTVGAAILCNGGTTTVTVTATGGTAPYTGTGTFTVSAGAYSYTVTDANGCTSVTSGTITQPTALTATATSTPVTTTGGSDGTATVSAAGGTAPYTYLWSPGGQTTATATGLTAGNYTVAVTDANGCITSTGTTVGSPTCSILASASAGTIACFGGTTTLTVSVTGATGATEYSLNGGAYQSSNTFTVSAGTYTVTVRDAILCTGTAAAVTVTQPSVLTASSSATAIACNGGSSTVTVSATGGTAPYTGTGTFSQTAGTYTFTVTDARGCTAVTTVTIAEPALLVASSSATAIACNGGSATVTVSATGGTAPYTGTGTFSRTAGTYTFTVTDAKGCTAVTTVTIGQPALLVASSSATVIACNGGSATVTVSATGGTAPYTGTGTQARTAGTYSFTVTDANGCTAVTTITVAQPAVLAVTATSTPANGGSNGTATATATGGTAPYTYLWAPGGQTTQTATGLAAGVYTVTVTDARGCTATATATVATNGCNLLVDAGPDKVICSNGSSVTLEANVTGVSAGVPPATAFTEVSGSTADMRIFSGNIDQVTFGNTFSQSEDRTNCNKNTTSSKAVILPPGAIVKKAYLYWSGSGSLDNKVKLNGTSVTADGTRTYSRSGGFSYFAGRKDVTSLVTASGTYTVTDLNWSNSSPYCFDNSAYGAWAITVIYENAALPSAKIHVNTEKFQFTYPAGTYSTTINNISIPAGCSPNAQLTVVAFEGDKYKGERYRIGGVLDADTNNFRGQAGPNLDIITKSAPGVVGGTTSLTYSIESYQTNTVFGPAIEGLFDYVKVLKYNYCPPAVCNVAYQWKKNGTVVGTTKNITVSSAGTYTVTATDCKGCVATDEVVVATSTLAATATAGPAISCNGGTTTVTVAATGGTAPYSGTGTFSKAAGTYTFTVSDAKGCTATATVTIAQPTQLVVTATAPAIPCGGTTTTVTVSATGGTAPYTGTGTFTKGPGTWTFTVTDDKGCVVAKTVVIGNAVACGPVDPNKCYKLVARNSGKAATVAGSSTANGGNVEQRSYNGGNNQIWKFSQVETGFYSVTNVNSGKVLDVTNASTANGANVQQWAWANGNNQKWSLTASGSYFVIKAKHSGKAMSVAGASNSNGANVEQRGNGNNTNEQWTISEVGCPIITRSSSPELIVKAGGEINEELAVTVQPNPGITYFNLTVKSGDFTTPVDVKVLDANGRVVAVHQKVGVNSTLRINAEKWTGGIYFAEVTQGGERKVVKMIKVN